jgi:hypothetical protein
VQITFSETPILLKPWVLVVIPDGNLFINTKIWGIRCIFKVVKIGVNCILCPPGKDSLTLFILVIRNELDEVLPNISGGFRLFKVILSSADSTALNA